MSVNQDTWWGETMAITVEVDSTAVNVGGAQSVSISPSGEHTNLFTSDSVLREDVRRGNMLVDVSFEYAKWGSEFVKQWLGGGTGEKLTIEDTSEVTQFTFTGTIENGQGDTLEVEVVNVDFEELDIFEASMGEFISQNQSGTGDNVNITETENV